MEDDTSVVIDCPVCKRTIWWNSRCYHGLTELTPAEEKTEREKVVEPYDPRGYEKKKKGGDGK